MSQAHCDFHDDPVFINTCPACLLAKAKETERLAARTFVDAKLAMCVMFDDPIYKEKHKQACFGYDTARRRVDEMQKDEGT